MSSQQNFDSFNFYAVHSAPGVQEEQSFNFNNGASDDSFLPDIVRDYGPQESVHASGAGLPEWPTELGSSIYSQSNLISDEQWVCSTSLVSAHSS